jgi:hypothetical protein
LKCPKAVAAGSLLFVLKDPAVSPSPEACGGERDVRPYQ